MLRPTALAAITTVSLLTSCGPNIKNSAQVRSDLITHLQKDAGLDPSQLDMNITKLDFRGNTALATVAFHPKNASSLSDSMVMNYTLVAKDGHWVVTRRADSQGHGSEMRSDGGQPGRQLPPGHPSLDGPGAPDRAPGTATR